MSLRAADCARPSVCLDPCSRAHIIEETTKDHSSPSFRDKGTGPMTDLSRSVEGPAATSLPYVDPAFPHRPLVLHAGRPRDYRVGIAVLFVHHGVRRNDEDLPGLLAGFSRHGRHFGNLRRVPRGVVPRASLVP